jgi:uncharacterized membrane protein YqhA
MNDAVLQILKDLFVTPNGRLFFIGSVLAAGSGYYVFEYESKQLMFAYAALGVGSLMIAGSMAMATFSKYMIEIQKMETRKLDAQLREERMRHGEKDRTIYKVNE